MPIPAHILHLYQKPKAGNQFIRRLPVYNYEHSIESNGWYDSAGFDVALRSVDEMQQFLDQYLGNRVAIYVDNPLEPVWEGYISRMSFKAGGSEYSISLDKMANRVTVQYSLAAATSPDVTTTGNDTNSQAIYGIKQETVELGAQTSLNATTFNALRDSVLAQRAWPQTSIVRGDGAGLLNVECLGFYHTLEWESFRNTTTGNVQLRNFITTLLLPGLGNGTTFFDNTDFTDIGTNTLSVNQNKIRGSTFWEIFKEIQEYGDATNPFVLGITPTLYSTGTRRLYYRALNTAIEYTARVGDGLRVRNLYGQIVPPWLVRPDRGIRVSDMLIGWNGLGDNPTETYIKSIEYNANQQSIDWHGDDDRTNEGFFNFKNFAKAQGKPFGAVRRVV